MDNVLIIKKDKNEERRLKKNEYMKIYMREYKTREGHTIKTSYTRGSYKKSDDLVIN